MKNTFIDHFRYLILLLLSFSLDVVATSAEISRPSFVRLSNHIPHKALVNAVLLNNLEADQQVDITFMLPLRNQEALEKLIEKIYDPTNQEHFGKYLTSEEFIEKFSPTQEDYNQVIAYAEELGFTIKTSHPNRLLLNVSGAASFIESAFNLSLHHYQLPNGRKFYAPSHDPEVPVSAASLISGIVGLDNHAVWRPFHRLKQELTPHPSEFASHSFPSGPGGGFSPSDLVEAYSLKGISENGSGQIIALFELAGYRASDIETYANHFGLPSPKLKNILVDNGPELNIDPEVTLDIELAIALAPESQIYVYEGPNTNQGVLDTYNRIATDNQAKQISTSWGLSEDLVSIQYLRAENAIFLQMAAQGQTIYAAAGDSGAYDEYPSNPRASVVVDDPACQPYVVGVGGTTLRVNSATCAYENEKVWNSGVKSGAGGGGVSNIWSIPAWQTHVPTVYSKTHRNVPDVALNADTNTGYAIYHNGQWVIYGGTSCAAPLWAAFTALVNEHLESAHKPTIGFANPILYSIGSGSSYATDFHDISLGDNLFYEALTGYDNASGWGSFNGTNLFASLTNSSSTQPPSSVPHLSIDMTNAVSFRKGGMGTYQIRVSNQGNGPTSGPVTVSVALPKNIKYYSFHGTEWVLNTNKLIFTQNSPLQPGASYPTLTLNVKINSKASGTLSSTATVSGGGSSSSQSTDQTNIK